MGTIISNRGTNKGDIGSGIQSATRTFHTLYRSFLPKQKLQCTIRFICYPYYVEHKTGYSAIEMLQAFCSNGKATSSGDEISSKSSEC